MTVVYLSIEDFAERAGLKPATLRNYRVAGLLPEPDVLVAQSPGWKKATVDRWVKQRGRPNAWKGPLPGKSTLFE